MIVYLLCDHLAVMGESETRKSVRWKEMSTITQTTEDIITSYLTASDENQNKLQEAEVMDLEAVKHDSENRNPEEGSPTNIKSPSYSLDHGRHFKYCLKGYNSIKNWKYFHFPLEHKS